jgi:DNA-binding transcriptional LysR family regulator
VQPLHRLALEMEIPMKPQGEVHVIDGVARLVANNMQMLLAAALEGAGVAYGPSFVFGERIARGDLAILLPDHQTLDLSIHAVYPTKRYVTFKLRRFIEHLVVIFGDTPP